MFKKENQVLQVLSQVKVVVFEVEFDVDELLQ